MRDDVARLPGVPPRGFALARQADLVAIVDARRDRHAQRALALDAAVAVARVARRLDDLAGPATAVAHADVDHLAEHRLAHVAQLACALALRAAGWFSAGFRSIATPLLSHRSHARELDFLLAAGNRSANVSRRSYRRILPCRRSPA